MLILNRKLSFSASLITLFFLGLPIVKAELPSQVTFSNDTSLSLGTSIAGVSGQPIPPNFAKTVNYFFVTLGCYYSKSKNNCAIEFTDASNGAPVATVYLNAETATLSQPPIFYGSYAQEYEIRGWEMSPISEISIVKRA